MVNGSIETLFKDRKQQEAVFPTTKVKAVSDDNGIGLNVLLEQMDEQINEKAPSGFGYGEVLSGFTSATEEELETNLDTIIATMSNYTTKQVRMKLQFLGTEIFFLVDIYRHNTNYAMITFQAPRHNGIILQKVYATSGWQPIEWVNPLMATGIEYRTIERLGNDPVYAKRVAYTIPSGGIGSTSNLTDIVIPHEISNFGRIVRYCANAGNYPLPSMSSVGGSTSVNIVDATNIHLRIYKDTWSAGTFYFNLYYTKAT